MSKEAEGGKARSNEEIEPKYLECQEPHRWCKVPSTDSYCDRRQGHPDLDHRCKSCGKWF